MTSFIHLSRRSLLAGLGLGALGACAPATSENARISSAADADLANVETWRSLSDEDWRERLDEAAYRVMRLEGTEPSYSSPLHDETRQGTYHCAGCDLPLFSSDTKFDSGTGWPSFWAPIGADRLGTKPDNKLWYTRTEYHCARCLSHQGHIFEDGPEPTGLRYCNNGVALSFRPA